MVLGLVPLLILYVINIMIFGISDYSGLIDELHAFGLLTIFIILFPPLYVICGAVGVYFVGGRGKQTGSFLATLGSGLLGLIVMVLFMFYPIRLGTKEEELIRGGLLLLMLLIGPIMATLGFNLTRRYKVQISKRNQLNQEHESLL